MNEQLTIHNIMAQRKGLFFTDLNSKAPEACQSWRRWGTDPKIRVNHGDLFGSDLAISVEIPQPGNSIVLLLQKSLLCLHEHFHHDLYTQYHLQQPKM